jgi:hypothetical protein
MHFIKRSNVLLSVSKQQKIQPRKLEWIVFYIFFGNISILCRHNLIYNPFFLYNPEGFNADKLTLFFFILIVFNVVPQF